MDKDKKEDDKRMSSTFNLQPSPTLREKAKKITRYIVAVIMIFRFCKCSKKHKGEKKDIKKNTI